MNRFRLYQNGPIVSIPHASGDEPTLTAASGVTIRSIRHASGDEPYILCGILGVVRIPHASGDEPEHTRIIAYRRTYTPREWG